jgi:hypothetical protein
MSLTMRPTGLGSGIDKIALTNTGEWEIGRPNPRRS